MGRAPRAGSPAPTRKNDRRRTRRARPTPKWIAEREDLNAIAKRRCLMVLSVLSGERPVTDAIEEAQISRPFYYQLETRALNAMLQALTPGSDSDSSSDAMGTTRRIAELEEKVARLEQEKRRVERLLLLTRKVMKPGPVSTGAGRPRKARPGSTSGGPRPSPGSPRKAKKTTGEPAATPSTPTPDGATTP